MAHLGHIIKDVTKGLFALSPLAALLALRRPSHLHIMLADTLRAYRTNAGVRIPSILASQLLEQSGPVDIRTGEHNIYPEQASRLEVVELIALLKPQNSFEIGTFLGHVTGLIAMNTDADAKVYTLDLPTDESVPQGISDRHLIISSKHDVGEKFRNTPWAGEKIIQLFGDSKTFDYSPYHDQMDFVLIDASHTYEFVHNDSLHAFRMIREGGVILWHDYESARSEYGVTRFCDRLRKRHGCPVYRLGHIRADSRYALMRVDDQTLKIIREIAERPESF